MHSQTVGQGNLSHYEGFPLEIIATLQSLKTVIALNQDIDALSFREEPSTQEGTSAWRLRGTQRHPSSLNSGSEKLEEQGDSNCSSPEEGGHLESDSQDSEDSRQSRHLFAVEDMEGLLRVI